MSGREFKANELRVGSRGVNINLKVVEKREERQVISRLDNSEHRVADILVGDETGCLILTLWDDMINKVAPGDNIRLQNGYISIFKSSLRLNVGRYGKLEKISAQIPSVNTENNLSEKRIQA